VTTKFADVILEARPLSDQLIEGTIAEGEEIIEDSAVPIDEELMRAFAADASDEGMPV